MASLVVYYNVRRTGLALRPKEPFVQWLKSIKYHNMNETVGFEGDLYLLPDFETVEEMEEWLETNYDEIFRHQLGAWYLDDALWPSQRTFAMFKSWFSYEKHTMVWDIEEGELEKA